MKFYTQKYEDVKELNLQLKKLFYLGKDLLQYLDDTAPLHYYIKEIVALLQNEETRTRSYYNDDFIKITNKLFGKHKKAGLIDYCKLDGDFATDIVESYVLEVSKILDMYIDYRGGLKFEHCDKHNCETPHMIADDGMHCLICIGEKGGLEWLS
jgi:hypothetical protein